MYFKNKRRAKEEERRRKEKEDAPEEMQEGSPDDYGSLDGTTLWSWYYQRGSCPYRLPTMVPK